MNDEVKEDGLIKINRKFFNYLISLRNRDLRKEIENCNLNAILQLIRYCEYEITNLQEENEKYKKIFEGKERLKYSTNFNKEEFMLYQNILAVNGNVNDLIDKVYELEKRYEKQDK